VLDRRLAAAEIALACGPRSCPEQRGSSRKYVGKLGRSVTFSGNQIRALFLMGGSRPLLVYLSRQAHIVLKPDELGAS
jgi:hypothetical protein